VGENAIFFPSGGDKADPKPKNEMSKNTQSPDATAAAESSQSTAPFITESKVRETLTQLALDLEIPKETCSSEHYGMLIMGTLMRLDISGRVPAEFLPLAMQAWTFIPKNPSAMRQAINREDKAETAPAVSKLLGKLLPGA
jgi:hypothetical protein